MLDRSELHFNEEFVKMFEDWVSIVYPDILDKPDSRF